MNMSRIVVVGLVSLQGNAGAQPKSKECGARLMNYCRKGGHVDHFIHAEARSQSHRVRASAELREESHQVD
jgi:hypothetical protein